MKIQQKLQNHKRALFARAWQLVKMRNYDVETALILAIRELKIDVDELEVLALVDSIRG